MLRHRLLLGPVLIAAVIGATWLDEALLTRTGYAALIYVPLLLVIGILASTELAEIFKRCEIAVTPPAIATAVALGCLASGLTPQSAAGFSGIAVVCTAGAIVLVGSLVYYSRNRNTQGVAAAVGATLFAFVYLGVMGGFLIILRKEHSAWLVLGILLVTKSYDIGAYFTGRRFGRTKLIHWLSPGKTWEGLAGGLLLSSLIGALAASLAGAWPQVLGAGIELRWWHGAAMGFVFGLVGQCGDLFASLLKRDAGIKDASKRLPGFGGVLDVIDSPILVAPVAYWVLVAIAAAS